MSLTNQYDGVSHPCGSIGSAHHCAFDGQLDEDRFNTIDIAERIHLRAASFCMAQGDNTDEIGRSACPFVTVCAIHQ